MEKKRKMVSWLAGAVLCLCLAAFGGRTDAAAATGGGSAEVRAGQSDIYAGVVVDYMGKLQFVVLDEKTRTPIPGASVEIYIPSLDRYVLFGVTDADGIFTLDVAYNFTPGFTEESQFTDENGNMVFKGSILYLSDNNLSWRVYKADWLPYPKTGTVKLETKEVPQIVEVLLHKKTSGGGGGGDNGGGGGSQGTTIVPPLVPGGNTTVTIPEEDIALVGIPKTGVEGAVQYWIAGIIFFLLAGGIVWYLMKKEREANRENGQRGGH